MSSRYFAKFFDVASDIFPIYQEDGFITKAYGSKANDMIHAHVNKNKSKFHPGDILFVGSTNQTRQYYGFVIIGNDYQLLGDTESATYLPIKYRNKIPELVTYEKMVEYMFNSLGDQYHYDLVLDFFGAVDDELKIEYLRVVDDYKEKGIW